ncbi:MAG: hypothetical protein AAF730_06340 [Bacteroidota bacterium]
MIRLLRTAIFVGAAVGVAKAVQSLVAHRPPLAQPQAGDEAEGFEQFTAEEQDLLMREMDASF